jgi:DNA primase
MIKVNETYISADVDKIVDKLKTQLEIQGIKRFYKSIDTPNNYMVCCPFHKNGQERKPSMGILKSDGTCHCFACGYVASLPEMISNCLGYDDMGNMGSKWLIRNFQSISVEEREDIDIDFSRGVKPIHNTNYVTEEELDKYRWTHPYWKKRGITDERIIELFDLGYDKETDCITMPVRDKSGHTLFVARRSVKTKFFNYPEGVEKPLYGLFEIYSDACKIGTRWEYGKAVEDYYSEVLFPKEVIVCESMIDALTCWQYGKYAVALNGLGTSEQFKQLQRLNCRKLIIATDNDQAGQAARYRIKQNIKNKILTQYVLPQGKKDINDLTEEEFNNLPEIFL